MRPADSFADVMAQTIANDVTPMRRTKFSTSGGAHNKRHQSSAKRVAKRKAQKQARKQSRNK